MLGNGLEEKLTLESCMLKRITLEIELLPSLLACPSLLV
jgi:hypothetical protein